MATYVQFAALGLGLAAVYMGLSTGMLMVYRATGLINFAHGAVAMWGAFVFAQLRLDGQFVLPIGSVTLSDGPLPLPASVLVALAMSAVIGTLVHLLVFRPVRRAPVLAQVVVSVALMIAMQALVLIRFEDINGSLVESIVPTDSLDFLGATISVREPIMAAIMVVLTVLVWAYFRFTRVGLATRAAAENERGVVLRGLSPDRLSAVAIICSTMLGTIAIILGSSLTGLDAATFTLLVVPALAVLLVARMSSLSVIVVAAIALGVFQSLINLWLSKPWWPTWAKSGLDQVVPFFVIVLILFVLGRRMPSRGSLQAIPLPDVTIPRLRPRAAILGVGLTALLLAVTSGTVRFGLTYSIILMILALSYVVITGYLGQMSLAQMAFAGTAGFLLSKTSAAWGTVFPIDVFICGLAAAALGLLVALPALRIRGAQLAIVTLAAALAVERFVFNNYSLTPPSGNLISNPELLGLDLGVRQGGELSRLSYSLTVLAIAVLLLWLFYRVASGVTGHVFLAVRANERAAASSGINVRTTKLIGFGLSAFLAGVAGCLIGFSAGQLSAGSFTLFVGLQILVAAYLGGITSIGGAIVAGIIGPLGVVYVLLNDALNVDDYYALVSGMLLIVSVMINPIGIAGASREQAAWVRARLVRRRSIDQPPPPLEQPEPPMVTAGRSRGSES
jgi:branched-chain amino acid transport system permease protein